MEEFLLKLNNPHVGKEYLWIHLIKRTLNVNFFQDLKNLLDISVDFVAELGTTNITIQKLLRLERGSVILKNQQERVWSFISTIKSLAKVKWWSMKKTLPFIINEILDSKQLSNTSKKRIYETSRRFYGSFLFTFAQTLTYNVYERSDRIDVMLSFGSPHQRVLAKKMMPLLSP